MAQIDEKSEIPPQVQMQMAQQQKQIEQMQQQLQAAQLEINNRMQVAQLKDEGETKRKLMDVTARAHNTETIAESRVNNENMRRVTTQNRTEIEALVKILLARMPPDQLMMEIDKMNQEQAAYAQFSIQDISEGANPLIQPMQ
jgi:uncharacterized protein with PIN domain